MVTVVTHFWVLAKKLKMRKYKKYIKKHSKEIQKIIGARKGLEC
jgi:hypothetical protein